MCTAISFRMGEHYFGRTLDLDKGFGEQVVITPRCFPFLFRKMGRTDKHFAIIGMAAVVLAKCMGAKNVVMVGRNPVKLAVAEQLGAQTVNIRNQDPVAFVRDLTNGNGAEFILECSGAPDTFKQVLDMVSFHGVVSLIGFYENKEDQIDVNAVVSKALHIFGVMGEFDNMSGVLKVLEKHRPNLLPIITDELPFDDCLRGFIRKNYPNAVKIAVRICGEE